uniref:RING finger protein 17 n=1 Tax=Otus sunia TaxID=257818 RepID=A0A8C8AJS7_9STRI
MAIIYEESQPRSVKWESSMHCAVYVWDLKQWQRGQISRIVSETSVKVLLYDFGAEKTVDISCLRTLEEDMKIIRTLAVECSLVDIRPTGGSTQWTATACEYLSYYLMGAQVKIIIQVCNQNHDVACALPVKIFCKDETGQLIDISEHLIKKGLALRNKRTVEADVACSVSKEHLEHLEQENTELDRCNSETACARNSAAPEENVTVSESEQTSCKIYKSVLHSGTNETYKSPIMPEVKIFQAVVSCVGCDGTIYIIPKSLEMAFEKLMTEIQNNFRCLGLLEPYCWKKGEACVVRGSDTRWYRGKVVELSGDTLEVQYIDHGCTERIPQCHLYPTTLYTDIPPFCIPCQLYKTVPVSNGRFADVLELLEDLPVLPSYMLPSLPISGETFPVRVTHLVSPKEVCFVNISYMLQTGNVAVPSLYFGVVYVGFFIFTGMPCLVEYQDGLWYRAKLLSIEESDPVNILVQFVDYGSFLVVQRSRLRHIPTYLLKYPVQAVQVLLAGFKPALYDKNVKRIPYSPEWSMEALWAMMEHVEGKQLSAYVLAVSPKITISLYDDENLVHMKLIEMGLADLDE